MTNRELDQLLKSASTPGRADGYWRDFPKRVTAKLHWQLAPTNTHSRSKVNVILAWSFGLATVFVAAGLLIKFRPVHSSVAVDDQLAAARKCYREIEALFPNQVQGIVFDAQGPRMLIADAPNVPRSTPFYLKICGPKGCESFVTFSGQQVQIEGENCEVLADAQDRLMLVGNHQVWPGNGSGGAIRVEAQPLEAAL
jgi:hypothetical protein